MENFGTLVTQALLLSSTWHRFYQVNVGNGEGPCCGPSTCHAWKILDPKAKKRFLEMEAKAGGGTAPSHVLPPDCLLSTVLRMQSLVPPVPIEDLLLKYQELRDRREDLVKLLHGPFSHPLWSSVVKGLPPGPDDADEHLEAFREIQRFQISATANDCSLFLTFAPVGGPRNGFDVGVKEGRGYVRDASGSWYACQVKIIDVDPKSPDRISKYIRQDAESRALFCRLHPS
ncbi:unnamed protein product [Darwinula stevensoni]|uniref:Inositol-pentakisphosphate 2-kinase n=1 Tax=Darwinula stevensoni TaxID=69355 RepID=A0A7R8X027_9CRUS|nr:unnamed protein product [Darwinula stevensoni]CAG0881203.1 unnamed protein product [Darwinula stevensoni]